jgi:SPP1 family predicted phage head-tail adaptor
MEAGELKRPITVEAPSTTQDAFGQPTSTWTRVVQTWASINTVTSKELYALGSGFTSQVTHRVTVRYDLAVTINAGYRVCYMGRHFQVQAVSDPDEQRVQRNLLCLELSK